MPGPQDRWEHAAARREPGNDAGLRPDLPARDLAAGIDRPVRGSLPDLRYRLELLPPGHPSSPYRDDGTPRPAEPRLRDLELPLPGEEPLGNGAQASQRRDLAARASAESRQAAAAGGETAAQAGNEAAGQAGNETPARAATQVAAQTGNEAAGQAGNETPARAATQAAAQAGNEAAVQAGNETPARAGSGAPAGVASEPAGTESDSAQAATPDAAGADRTNGSVLAGSGHRSASAAGHAPAPDPTAATRLSAAVTLPATDSQRAAASIGRVGATATPGRPTADGGAALAPAPATFPDGNSAATANGSTSQQAVSPGRPTRGVDLPADREPAGRPADQGGGTAGSLAADLSPDACAADDRPGLGADVRTARAPLADVHPDLRVIAEPDVGGGAAGLNGSPPELAGEDTANFAAIDVPGDEDGPQHHRDGSWFWKGRRLDAAQCQVAERTLERCRMAAGRNVVGSYGEEGLTAAMRRLEARLEHGSLADDPELSALKDADQFKAKLADRIQLQPGTPPDELAARIHDGVRYAFLFEADRYTEGFWRISENLDRSGFQLIRRKPSWDGPDYRGISSVWRDPESGVLFEVQFHTPQSWAARQQVQHGYDRCWRSAATPAERHDQQEHQRKVMSQVPVPLRARDVPSYRDEAG